VVERGELVGGGSTPLTGTTFGIGAIALFAIAYALVMAEDFFLLRKSIPIMVAAGLIWVLVALAYQRAGNGEAVGELIGRNLLDFGELFLFLLAAVTFVNTMEERQVFDALRGWLVGRKLTLRGLFWVTGLFAFLISPFADNLTTALVMGAVVMAIAGQDARFLTVACINIVVAANAGGAFSPFGDITTLMVWQHGSVDFNEFFSLFLPAVVNWLVPAIIMSLTIEHKYPSAEMARARLRPGARAVVALFVATIALTVVVHHFLHLPPVLGMMTGLGVLNLYSHFLSRRAARLVASRSQAAGADRLSREDYILSGFAVIEDPADTFDVFGILQRVEWDTMMFFYGVILCVGGLGALGYLALMSHALYGGFGATTANTLVGLLSAVIDNIPIMFAVLSMNPDMSHNQWLLVTLTAGVGGSLLSIGSAAGVALMGQARGLYTFGRHLRWTWAVALGYAASIAVHLLINGS
jgi:Na+/H+ antiporter NhaD/arsenite permease-like protein